MIERDEMDRILAEWDEPDSGMVMGVTYTQGEPRISCREFSRTVVAALKAAAFDLKEMEGYSDMQADTIRELNAELVAARESRRSG